MMSLNRQRKEDVFAVLMKGAQERCHVPEKWRAEAPVNKKLELNNACDH